MFFAPVFLRLPPVTLSGFEFCHWFTLLFASVEVCQNDNFRFSFTTFNWKPLSNSTSTSPNGYFVSLIQNDLAKEAAFAGESIPDMDTSIVLFIMVHRCTDTSKPRKWPPVRFILKFQGVAIFPILWSFCHRFIVMHCGLLRIVVVYSN